MHRRRLSALLLAATSSAAICAGCGDDTVDVRAATSASAPGCARVGAHWPATVARQKTRTVSTHSRTVHAWGDPAIIARCGVTPPPPTTDECFTENGVDWVAQELTDGVRFTTYGRTPAIEVLMPLKYRGWTVAAFAPAARQIAQGPRCS